MAKSMINKNEQERLAALNSYQILDTLPKEAFDRFTKLAAIICKVPISLVSLVDENRQWFKSQIGIDVKQTPRSISFCSHTITDDRILEIEDATKDLRFKDNPLVTAAPNIKFYAGFPLVDPQGFALGTLCVIDTKPNKLSETQKEALKLLAQSVIDLIVLQRKTQEIENFDKLFQISRDLICVLEPNGAFATTNNAFNLLLGWERSSLLKESIFDFIHPDDLAPTKEALHKLATGVATVRFSHRFKTKDNAYRILSWVATLEPSSKKYFAIARDVTDARERENALNISEKKLRAFFENATAFMCTHDLEGRILTVNSAGAKSLGYTTDELVGKTLFQLIPESRYEYMKLYLSAIKTEGKVEGIMYTKHKNGSKLTWLFNNVLETSANGEQYVIGNAVDITERYQLEADLKRTKEMMEQTNGVAKIGAWEVDIKNNKIYWSRITKRLHEVSEDFEPNLESAIAFYGDHNKLISDAFEKAVKQGISYDLELKVTTAKGNKLWIRTIGTPEFKNGKCIRVFGTFQDITENYLHRIALNEAKVQAEEASIAKSEFLASMSHEIRTPLNGVIGFTDLVLKTALNQTQHQYLTIVNQSANALLAIINDILDFSKIEAGKLELDIEKSDLFELSSQASDIITFQAQNKGLEVLLNIDPNLPRYIFIDSTRLKQVLVNLLGNAIKFTEQGEIELKIYGESDLNKEYVDFCFEVRDTGIGIQPEKQHKIFDAFSQEDASTTKKYGGTGLGLTISNRLLGLMNSELQLNSKVGFGSTFYFKIRLKAEHGDSHTADISFIKKALVVDDNENNRLILKQMLLLKNIVVTEAKNGLEALQLLSEGKRYDVILMDYHMPYMDGLETIEKIRKNFEENAEKQPIMLLHSSSDDEKIIQICEEYGVNLRMVKPIKMQDLFSKLARIHDNETQALTKGAEETTNNFAFNILVVEDNLVNKLLAKTVISKILPNAHVSEASNGHEAVEQHQKQNPDLIFMDLQMPLMNGYDATKEIRIQEKKGAHKSIIVALTAGNVKGEKERCLEIGMDDFVTKPFVEEDLAELFSKWLMKSEELSPNDPTVSETKTTHFDTDKLKLFMGNDTETIKLVLNLTIDELKKAEANFKELLNHPDLSLITALGHKLFGTSSGTGLDVLAQLSREIENQETLDEEHLNYLYTELQNEIKLVISLIKEELENLK